MAREMKDSGIEWIGEIPAEWGKNKTTRIFGIIGSGTTPKFEEVNHSDNSIHWIQSGDINGAYLTKCKIDITEEMLRQYSALTHYSAPFIIIAMYGASIGNISLSQIDGCVNQACCVLSRSNQNISYMFFALKMSKEYLIWKAVGGGQPNINQEIIKKLWIPIPSMKEQNRIVQFLYSQCECIDGIIKKTIISIEEYKKLKQAVITQAVTKGIRPDRPMKDSGVEWIGIIPENWHVAKLKYFASIRSGITLGKLYSSETKLVEYPYLRVANVQGSYVDLTDVAMIKVTEEEAIKYRLKDGELLMTEGGDRDKLGRGTVWHAQIDPCLHQNHVFALRTNEKLLAEYVSYLSASFVGRDYFDVTANQSVHLASTNSTTIMNFTIPYPSTEEQKEIVDYLDDKTAKIDQMISGKMNLLSELDSYKKSLIYEYVTGKKEVPA